MPINNLITSAYRTYADVQNIIDLITDNDYISVSELAKLLCKILDTSDITAKTVNRILSDKHFIIKQYREVFLREKNSGLKPSKYIPASSFSSYFKKKFCADYSFYLIKFDVLKPLFNLDFRNTMTQSTAINLCCFINKYVSTSFDTDTVFLNLIKLRIILQRECLLF